MLPGTKTLIVTLLLSVLVGWAGDAHAQVRRGDFSMSAPDELRLGETEAVEVSAQAPNGRELRFSTNVGSVESLQAREGRSVVRYSPPAGRAPQFAIIVALTDDFEQVDWVIVPLLGSATVRVEFEARSRVTVRVAGLDFGPVDTRGSRGAELTVTVPPGVSEAIATGVDRLGNEGQQTLPLNPPPLDRAVAICAPEGVGALYIALAADGSPLEDSAAFDWRASQGSFAAVQVVAPGLFYVPYTAPASERASEDVVLTSTLDGQSDECVAEVRRVPPTEVQIELSRDEAPTGGADVEVTLRVGHVGGVPLLLIPVLDPEFGSTTQVEEVSEGVYRALWMLPPDIGVANANLNVHVGELRRSTTLRIAQARGPWNIGVHLGFLTNLGRVTAPLATLRVEYALRSGSHSLLLGVRGGFWRSSDTSLAADNREDVTLRLLAFPVLARVGYRFELGRVDLLAAVDGGIVIANGQVSSPTSGQYTLSSTQWALGGALGAAFRVGPGAINVEVGYLYSPMDDKIPGNVAGLRVTAGYTLELPI